MYVCETYMYTIYPYVYTLARHTDYTYIGETYIRIVHTLSREHYDTHETYIGIIHTGHLRINKIIFDVAINIIFLQ